MIIKSLNDDIPLKAKNGRQDRDSSLSPDQAQSSDPRGMRSLASDPGRDRGTQIITDIITLRWGQLTSSGHNAGKALDAVSQGTSPKQPWRFQKAIKSDTREGASVKNPTDRGSGDTEVSEQE